MLSKCNCLGIRRILLFFVLLCTADIDSVIGGKCTRAKCTSTNGGRGYDCIAPSPEYREQREFVEDWSCSGGYEARSIDNFGPIGIDFTCCPLKYNGTIPSSVNATTMSQNFGLCDSKKCKPSNCVILTPDYGRLYFGFYEAGEASCVDGFEPIHLFELSAYTCCPPEYSGPVTANLIEPPSKFIANAMGYIFGVLAIVSFLGAATFIIVILASKESRSSSFNVYLVALVLPEMLLNGVGATEYFTADTKMIRFWLLFFYWVCNIYLNAIVAYEIHEILKCSQNRMHKAPPTVHKALVQIGCCFFFATVMATWYILDVPWSPYTVEKGGESGSHGSRNHLANYDDANAVKGVDEKPGIFSRDASLAIFFISISIPVVFVLYISAHIWWNKLLPISGRTRAIALYFNRIILVFFTCYLPGMILFEIFLTSQGPFAVIGGLKIYLTFVAYILIPIQAMITLCLAMFKPDLQMTFLEAKDSLLTSLNFSKRRFSKTPQASKETDHNGLESNVCAKVQTQVTSNAPEVSENSSAAEIDNRMEANRVSSSSFGPNSSTVRVNNCRRSRRQSQWDEDDVYASKQPV